MSRTVGMMGSLCHSGLSFIAVFVSEMLLQVLTCLLVLVLTRVVWRRWKYDLHRIPGPPTIPYFLETLKVMKSTDKGDLTQLRGRWWKKLGCPKLMKINMFGSTTLILCDMNCAKSVVMANKDPIPKARLTKNSVIMMLANDMNAKPGLRYTGLHPYVKSLRKVYSTALQSSNLKLAMPKLSAVIQRMLDIVDAERKQGPVDFQKLCVKMTLDAIGEVALACNLGGLDGSRNILQLIIDVGHIVFDRMVNPITRIMDRFFPHCQTIRQQNETIDCLTAEWTRITNDITEYEDPPAGEEPFWYGLKNLADPETGNSISFETLRAEVALVVLGGTDVTGHQIAWLLALLSSHPAVEDRLVGELKEHDLMGPKARDLAFDDLGELSYLNAVIKEGMRVAAVAVDVLPRQTPADMTLLGYRIPKGTLITLPGNRWMNSEADWGPDPEAFKPERWLAGEDMSDKYYIGFLFGPRDCIAQHLVLTEMKIAIIAILKQYRLSLTVPYETLLRNSRTSQVIQARDGILFNVTPRGEAREENGVDAA